MPPSGKRTKVELLLGGGEEEIALVPVEVGRAEQGALVALLRRAHVVAGRQRVGAEVLRGLQEVRELDGLVAGDAGDRGFAGDVAVGKAVHDLLLEAAFIVEHVVRDADLLGRPAGVVDVDARAAGLGLRTAAP
jgi:hypothetical protein